MLMECILQYEDGGGETMEGGELLSHTVSSVRADDLRPSCTRSVGCTKLTTWRTDLCSPPLIAQPSAAGIVVGRPAAAPGGGGAADSRQRVEDRIALPDFSEAAAPGGSGAELRHGALPGGSGAMLRCGTSVAGAAVGL